MNWDINPELSNDQRTKILKVLHNHKSDFATSLKEIKSLKVEQYSIKVKSEVKPVKVTPRMLPVAANEWMKGYISQLMELDMIESCSDP